MNTKTCKYCGVSGFVWKRLGQDRWALFETDSQGRPVRNHTAICRDRAAASGSDVAEVQRIIEEQEAAIGEFIDSASATLDAAREEAADAADRPELPRYEAAVRDTPAASEFPVPALDPSYLIDVAQLAAIKRVLKLAEETGQPQNIGLHGPAGSGKTTLAVQIGALHRGPTVVVDSTDKETANDWFSTSTLKDGTLTEVESDFVKAVETEGAVIVLDDVALLQSRTVQSGLNALLDPSRRSIFVQRLNREVRVAPKVIFVGTWNVGAEYTAASELSLQILDRFRSGALFEVPYPDDGVLANIIRARSACPKAVATRLADAAAWLRSDPDPIEPSTRGLVAAGNHVRQGATIGHALFYTVFGELDPETRQRAYTILATNITRAGYPDTERKLWEAPQIGNYVSLA